MSAQLFLRYSSYGENDVKKVENGICVLWNSKKF